MECSQKRPHLLVEWTRYVCKETLQPSFIFLSEFLERNLNDVISSGAEVRAQIQEAYSIKTNAHANFSNPIRSPLNEVTLIGFDMTILFGDS